MRLHQFVNYTEKNPKSILHISVLLIVIIALTFQVVGEYRHQVNCINNEMEATTRNLDQSPSARRSDLVGADRQHGGGETQFSSSDDDKSRMAANKLDPDATQQDETRRTIHSGTIEL